MTDKPVNRPPWQQPTTTTIPSEKKSHTPGKAPVVVNVPKDTTPQLKR